MAKLSCVIVVVVVVVVVGSWQLAVGSWQLSLYTRRKVKKLRLTLEMTYLSSIKNIPGRKQLWCGPRVSMHGGTTRFYPVLWENTRMHSRVAEIWLCHFAQSVISWFLMWINGKKKRFPFFNTIGTNASAQSLSACTPLLLSVEHHWTGKKGVDVVQTLFTFKSDAAVWHQKCTKQWQPKFTKNVIYFHLRWIVFSNMI